MSVLLRALLVDEPMKPWQVILNTIIPIGAVALVVYAIWWLEKL